MTETDGPGASGFVLIGGQSRRFGADKAAFDLDGVAAADRLARRLESVCDGGVVLVGRESAPWSKFPTVPDVHAGAGPIAGVATALERATTDHVLIVATDLWGATAADFGALLSALAGCDRSEDSGDVDLVCASTESGELQPLLAAWRVSRCREVVRRRIEKGEYSMFGVVDSLRTATVIVPADSLANVNSPEDLESFLSRG